VAVLSIAAAADLGSTHYALSRCPSCHETKPFMREPALGVLTKAAGVAGGAVLCRKLRKSGHGRTAKVVRWVVAGVWLGLAARNLHVARGR
jgi:hypothetical protein